MLPSAALKGDTEIAFSWFVMVDTGAGTHTISQTALSTDAQGTVGGMNYDIETAGMGVDIGGIDGVASCWAVVDGHIRNDIPEPATLNSLAIGAILIRHNGRR